MYKLSFEKRIFNEVEFKDIRELYEFLDEHEEIVSYTIEKIEGDKKND